MSATALSGQPARFAVFEEDGCTVVRPSGDWTVFALGDAPERLAEAMVGRGVRRRFDATAIGRVDTAGALAVIRAVGGGRPEDVEVEIGARTELDRLRDLVGLDHVPQPRPRVRRPSLALLFENIGRGSIRFRDEAVRDQAFIGRLMIGLAQIVRRPARLRLAALTSTMEHAGLNSLPIVFFMTFFVGAILALVGSTMLVDLGVSIYTVELVGIGIMREFGVVIAAILFAGRSAAAFAAQLGSMRMNQEIDAMQVMGVDTFEALVVPRVVAALLVMPIMTLVADIGGLAGGMMAAAATMDISPTLFANRLVDSAGTHQFWIGMSKAPFFALTIAAAGCRQGLSVGGDVESLGARVTSAVVQSIFMVVMFDAVFALLFRELSL